MQPLTNQGALSAAGQESSVVFSEPAGGHESVTIQQPFATIPIGKLPTELRDTVFKISSVSFLKKEFEETAYIAEQAKPVLQCCLEDNGFKRAWEKVRTSYGREPDIFTTQDMPYMDNTFVEVLTSRGVLKILRPFKIYLPLDLYPAHAVCCLARNIFKVTEESDVDSLREFLVFCRPERLKIETPTSVEREVKYSTGGITLSVLYSVGSVIPQVNISFEITSNASQ